ncbi:enoyl-CoA hydratase [compost metagenome]
MASLSGEVLVLIKQAARASASLPMDEGLRRERAAFHHTLSLPDHEEGMRAFLEKRPPRFNPLSTAKEP